MEDDAGQRKRARSLDDENGDAGADGSGGAVASASSGAGGSSVLLLPPRDDFDDAPRVRRGADAELGELRRALAEGVDPALRAGALDGEADGDGAGGGGDAVVGGDDGPDEGYEGPRQEREEYEQQLPEEEDEEEEERIMLRLPAFSASFVAGGTPSCSSRSSSEFLDAPGDVVVTTRRLFFVAGGPSDERDLAIDAGCVSLHAVSSEGLPGRGAEEVWHVYCQLAGGGCHDADGGGGSGDAGAVAMVARGIDPVEPDLESGDGDDNGEICSGGSSGGGGPTEVYFAPVIDAGVGEPRTKGRCQCLFDALSRMAAMNPIFDDDDEYGGGGGGAGTANARGGRSRGWTVPPPAGGTRGGR
uniref:Uncharacterized protein n=1 Tax=Odontella aurita TaxID=265563 RepID=A0A7S4JNA9_9STRA